MLGLSVPAIADVFVYDATSTSFTEFEYDDSANGGNGGWIKEPKPIYKEYFVIQLDENDLNSVNVWEIDTWKETNPTTYYYSKNGPDNISFLQTTIVNKNTWIANGALSFPTNALIMMSGQTKSVKINGTEYTVASTLSGYCIWGDIEPDEDVGVSQGTLSLDSKYTAGLIGWVQTDSGDVDSAIDDYFTSLGYTSQ